MKRLAVILAVPFALAGTEAQAGDLDRAVGIAHQVHPLPCSPKIEIAPTENRGAQAEAYAETCTVRYAPGVISTTSDAELCSITVHEFGHLKGLTFPGPDPFHSQDPRDNMHATGPHHPACGLSDEARLAAESRRLDLLDVHDALREGWRDRRCNRTRRRPVCRRIARKLSRVRISLRGLA